MFEFVDHTALDELDKYPSGAEETFVKKIMWQVLKGVEFCHQHSVRYCKWRRERERENSKIMEKMIKNIHKRK